MSCNSDELSDDEVSFGKMTLKELKIHILRNWNTQQQTIHDTSAISSPKKSGDHNESLKILQNTNLQPNLIPNIVISEHNSPGWDIKGAHDSFIQMQNMVAKPCLSPRNNEKTEEQHNTLEVIEYILTHPPSSIKEKDDDRLMTEFKNGPNLSDLSPQKIVGEIEAYNSPEPPKNTPVKTALQLHKYTEGQATPRDIKQKPIFMTPAQLLSLKKPSSVKKTPSRSYAYIGSPLATSTPKFVENLPLAKPSNKENVNLPSVAYKSAKKTTVIDVPEKQIATEPISSPKKSRYHNGSFKILQHTNSQPNLIPNIVISEHNSPGWDIKGADDSFIQMQNMVAKPCLSPRNNEKTEEPHNTLEVIEYSLNYPPSSIKEKDDDRLMTEFKNGPNLSDLSPQKIVGEIEAYNSPEPPKNTPVKTALQLHKYTEGHATPRDLKQKPIFMTPAQLLSLKKPSSVKKTPSRSYAYIGSPLATSTPKFVENLPLAKPSNKENVNLPSVAYKCAKKTTVIDVPDKQIATEPISSSKKSRDHNGSFKILQHTNSQPNLIPNIVISEHNSPGWDIKGADDSFIQMQNMVAKPCLSPRNNEKTEEPHNTLEVIEYSLNYPPSSIKEKDDDRLMTEFKNGPNLSDLSPQKIVGEIEAYNSPEPPKNTPVKTALQLHKYTEGHATPRDIKQKPIFMTPAQLLSLKKPSSVKKTPSRSYAYIGSPLATSTPKFVENLPLAKPSNKDNVNLP